VAGPAAVATHILRVVSDLPDYVRRNRASWDECAHEYVAAGRRNWAANEPTWGVWGVPEAEVGMLPAELDGLDAIELGCGTAYFSAWLARRGARPVGIDNSVDFHLPHGEMIDLLRDSGFEVEALTEIRPPEGSTTTYDFVTLDWARQWPCEEVWRARKRR
jgi:hypothetical protein